MITRQDVERLADFYSAEPSAVTFYFAPITPQDRSHRKEEIMIKDLIREQLRTLGNGTGRLKQDLEKVQQRARQLVIQSRNALVAHHDTLARIGLHLPDRFADGFTIQSQGLAFAKPDVRDIGLVGLGSFDFLYSIPCRLATGDVRAPYACVSGPRG